MERHYRTLGYLFAVWALVELALIFIIPFAAQRLNVSREIVRLVMIFAVIVPEAFYILAAWGLLSGAKWAVPVATAASVLVLFAFPLGTALGIYGLWVIISHRNKPVFSQYARFDSP